MIQQMTTTPLMHVFSLGSGERAGFANKQNVFSHDSSNNRPKRQLQRSS